MAVLYIREQGAVVTKLGERIVVKKNLNTLLDLPVFNADGLAVFGNVQITTQALMMLLENGCDITYFTRSGKYVGHTAAEASRNIFLRFEQYQCYLDDEKRLAMARTIIDSKIRNQEVLIKRHRWDTEEDSADTAGNDANKPDFTDAYDWRRDLKRMEELRTSLADQKTPNEILGVERMCSNIYFSAFGHMIRGDYDFHGRNRRPPKDPVNVILSLAYTFLTREMCSALDTASFESYLGFLHGIRYGRKSLALDMIEEFRQPAVDRLVLLLFGKRMLSQYDFALEDDRVVLNEEGFRKFCQEYERWMSGTNSLAGDNFHARIRDQVQKMKHSIIEGEHYKPYQLRQ